MDRNRLTEIFKRFTKAEEGQAYCDAVNEMPSRRVAKDMDSAIDFLDSLAGGVILPGNWSDGLYFATLNVLLPDGRIVAVMFEHAGNHDIEMSEIELTPAIMDWNDVNKDEDQEVNK